MSDESRPRFAEATDGMAGPGMPAQLMAHIEGLEGPRNMRDRFRRMVKDSPFWIVSLMIHVGVFVLLATIIMSTPQKTRKRILLNIEEVEITKTIQPMVREENLAESLASAMKGAAREQTYKNATSEIRDVEVDPIRPMGLFSPVKAGSQSEFESLQDNPLNMIGLKKVGDLTGAVDQFAIETLNSIARGPTIVILLVDESRSIVNKDLPKIISRMDHYFKQIELNLRPQFMNRAWWAVYSYGDKVTLRGEATSDLARTKVALRSVTADPSGREDVLAAINKALDQYGGKAKNVLIAALTDETGSDTENDRLLEATISRLIYSRVRFFVFGREANFGNEYQRVDITIGGKQYWNWAQMGPECPRQELWSAELRSLPSGFPMYSLNRIALATEGIYFLLEAQSNYDEKKLYAQYYPDYSSRRVYDREMQKNPLKRELAKTWAEIDKARLYLDLNSMDRIDAEIDRAETIRGYCRGQAVKIAQLRRTTPPEGRNWNRWLAHADVTRAMLLRCCYVFGQYRSALLDFKTRQKDIPDGQRVRLEWQPAKQQSFRGGRGAAMEQEAAQQALEFAFDQHRDTPWETLVRRLKQGVESSFSWTLERVPQSGPPPPSVPPPPV